MSAQYSEVFILVCELAEALGATPLNKHPVATGGPSHRVLRDAYAAMRAAKGAR